MSWIEFNNKLINLDKVSHISFRDDTIKIVGDDCSFEYRYSDDKAITIIERLKEHLNVNFEVGH